MPKKAKETPESTDTQKELKQTEESMLIQSLYENIEILDSNSKIMEERLNTVEDRLEKVAARLGIWKHLHAKLKEGNFRTM